MAKKKPAKGNTPATAFRLSAGTLAELDWLVKEYRFATGGMESRSSVVRRLVREDYLRRKGSRKP